MHLKSVRVQGFKTFARRTELPFGRGITAIVGPNGSGKSNLVDAIRWALGERNARGLRGQRMEDVIYGGGPGKSPVGMAEVTLVIDNGDQRLGIEFSEVEVARRLYRSGESEYLVNGAHARLKDIDAMLASTGLRQDGYAVTAQNDIDYVIQAAPAVRRELIEEAAGVRRLRDQRQEAVNRLTEADRDMGRARDLLTELNPRAEELRLQAGAAREYQRVADQLKTLQGSLARDAWRKAMVILRRAQARELAARARRDTVAGTVTEFDPVYAVHRDELLAAREARWTHQQALADLRLRAAETRHQVRMAQERAGALRQATAVSEQEIARLAESERAGGRVVEELERSVNELARAVTAAGSQAAAARQDEQAQRARLAQLEARRANLLQRRQDLHRDRIAAQAEIRQLEGRLQFLQEQQQQAVAQVASWSERNQNLLAALDMRRQEASVLEREVDASQAAFSQVEMRCHEAAGELTQAEESAATAGARCQAVEAEVGALRLLRDRAPQPQSRLGPSADPRLRRLLELIRVDEPHRAAVEAALEDTLSGWVALPPELGARAIALLTGGSNARETVLLDPGTPAHNEIPAGLRGVRSVVDGPAELDGLLGHLLAGVALVDDLAEARRVTAEHPRLRAVTRAGELVTRYLVRAGEPEHSPLSAQAQLLEAEAGVEAKRRTLAAARKLVGDRRSAHSALLGERAKAVARLEAARARRAELGSGLGTAQAAADREAEQGRRLDDQTARLGILLEQAGGLLAPAQAREATAQDADTGIAGELPAIDGRLREAGSERAGCLTRCQEAEIRAALAQQRHGDLVRQLERARQVFIAHSEELAERRAAAAQLALEPARVEAERGRWETAAAAVQEELAALEASELPDAESLGRLESRVRDDEQRNVALQVDMAHADDGLEAARADLATAQAEVDRCAEVLREGGGVVDEEEPVVDVDWQKTEREVSRLQRRLDAMGPVNLLAPEEYRQIQERCESLGGQLADLEAAAMQLTELRQRLEREIDHRFRTVFQSVAANFQEFFTELFEGGRATLRLEAQPEGNPLDDGVEILAQTPGKRLQPLTLLSGGERALTALAFLFALQAVNPSPFYVLDEVDAALDDANVVRFNRVLKRLARDQQFVIVTHNHSTMAEAEVLYGVTLAEHGISRIVSVRLEHDAAASLPRLRERTA